MLLVASRLNGVVYIYHWLLSALKLVLLILISTARSALFFYLFLSYDHTKTLRRKAHKVVSICQVGTFICRTAAKQPKR